MTPLDETPQDDMWTVREMLIHMIEVEWSFTLVNEFAIQRAGRGESGAAKISGEVWAAHFIEGDGFGDEVFQGGLQEILDFYDQLHQQALVLIVISRISAVYEHA